jgi:outer membrane protein
MKFHILLAFIILTALGANAQTAASTSPSNTIVFVNSDSLINNYEYYKAVRFKLQDLSQKAQAEITAKGAAFQKEVAAYQKSASSLNLVQRTATEKRLAAKQQSLQALSQNTGKQLQDEEADQNTKLYDQIAAYLKTYTKTKGYKIVLTYSKANPSMLYGDESLDVTKEVLAGLNEEYKKATAPASIK